jgi:hypothetical protein
MSAEDDVFRELLTPGARTKALWRGASRRAPGALKAAGAVRVDVAVVARVKEMSGLTI